MPQKTARQFGLWESPVTASLACRQVRLSDPQWDSTGHTLLWLEGRSDRDTLVALRDGEASPRDLTSDMNVGAKIGYGGGDYVAQGRTVFFVDRGSGRLYRRALSGGLAQPITPATGKAASPVVEPGGRWVAYVHQDEEDVDRIAVVDASREQWPQILTDGHDFYMQPRFSPDGRHFAWICWDHPLMPWDGSQLWLARVEFSDNRPPRLADARLIAGDDDTSIFQPEFTPDGRRLLFISDADGWGRLAVHELASGETRFVTSDEAEYGIPAWRQGMRSYAVTADGKTAVVAPSRLGFQSLQRVDLQSGRCEPLPGARIHAGGFPLCFAARPADCVPWRGGEDSAAHR